MLKPPLVLPKSQRWEDALQVHTWVPGEVAAFSPDNWGGDIFLDRDKAIYRAIGEGKVRKQPLWKVVANFCTIKGRIRSLQKQAPDIGRMRDLGFPVRLSNATSLSAAV